ncbi:hypothetical protein FB561_5363 [Kribbella amoyensis]|uniref:Glyoxalase-like domain-containing protein n=1 Tax=Kribbella amoyensis TaxID=996641 RepID=A0A561BZE6_9ACTN|nr:VOC family protein [Kribbella amoyensis]TWD84188.1 hypothetical protein FB561_5363 [Kribbella amoyensis]
MSSNLFAVCFGANDPRVVARFWGGVFGTEPVEDAEGILVPAKDDSGFRLRIVPTEERKSTPNQMHFDLTSTSLEDQQATVARALDFGGRHIDIGQLPEEGHVVLADPEGNELCVIPPGNNFLADCGFLGAIASDGTQAVGYFWSKALDWPLVWDQDEETAIQARPGTPKITWGGPPVAPKYGQNRLHLDLAPPAGSDQQAEAERLVGLGATRLGLDTGDAAIWMADPDGNEFTVLSPR